MRATRRWGPLLAAILLAACAAPQGSHENYNPSWSPDGRRIAFARYYKNPAGDYHGGDLFVIGVDARDPVRLTDGEGWDGHPTWSPGGTRIWFQSNRSGEEALHWISAEGGMPARTITMGKGGAVSVSPDGTTALYYSDKDGGDAEIYIADLETGVETRLTDNDHPDYNPSWHPDGTAIAYHSVIDGTGFPMVMNADGSGARRLAEGPGEDVAFSPDGSRVAFTSDRDGGWNVYVMDADGRDVRQVTDTEGRNFSPAWSPDGSALAFVSDRNGRHEIFLARADGQVPFQLTGKLPRRARFVPEEYEPYGRPGTAVIEGRAYLRLKDGGERDCPMGGTVFMNPVTGYSTEWYRRNVIAREELEPADRRSSAYHRITRAGPGGRFRFDGLPAGEYYLGCRVLPEEGFAHIRVAVADGETVQVEAIRDAER